MTTRIGLISFAHLHAHSYAAQLKKLAGRCEISGLYDDDPARGREIASQLGISFIETCGGLLDASDGVVICSENSKHKDFVLQAAEAKKTILCEKPISTNLTDARIMIDACEKAGAALMIAFPCRFSTPVFRAKQLIQDGKLGEIIGMKGTNRGTMPGGWFVDKALSGGGAVIDHTVHVLDVWRWILGREVTSVYAEMGTQFYPELSVEDAGTLSLEFEGGIFATLDTSWSRPNKSFPTWGDVTLEIVGEKGSITVDAFNQKYDVYNNDAVKAEWTYWGDDIDFGLIQSFLNVVEGKTPSPITGNDGLKALEAALGAYRSAETGQPTALPLA
ncbi:MAG: gfo/Idh/MocA family oxidoreductase [bacterium]|nr:gfo/Idh/MocA family oxidoreductase [bacterium]